MKTKLKECAGCNHDKLIYKRVENIPYCQQCYFRLYPPVKKDKVFKPINKRSDKRKEQEKLYQINRKLYINLHPICEVKFCNQPMTDIHHRAGKIGKLLFDVDNFLAVCRPHHDFIEQNPDWAKEMGYSKSRLNKE